MPCIWGTHSGSNQLFVVAAILPHSAPAAALGSFYGGATHSARALIDTGATTTCLSKKVVAAMNIQPVSKVPIHGVSGVATHNGYLFKVGFPFAIPDAMIPPGAPPRPPGHVPTALHVMEVVLQGVEFDATNANFDILLGMDVIARGALVVLGNGTFCFSF